MKKRFIYSILLFVSLTHADINKLTGQAQFSINLGPYANLLCCGDIASHAMLESTHIYNWLAAVNLKENHKKSIIRGYRTCILW